MRNQAFSSNVLKMVYHFECLYGKLPNELHIGSRWQPMYEDLVESGLFTLPADPSGKRKYWWFMGMRVFNEHWTHCVAWTKETAALAEAR